MGGKWVFSDPIFWITITVLGCFNYVFDQMFRGQVLATPMLVAPYIFQFHLILPVIDIALALPIFYGLRLLKRRIGWRRK